MTTSDGVRRWRSVRSASSCASKWMSLVIRTWGWIGWDMEMLEYPSGNVKILLGTYGVGRPFVSHAVPGRLISYCSTTGHYIDMAPLWWSAGRLGWSIASIGFWPVAPALAIQGIWPTSWGHTPLPGSPSELELLTMICKRHAGWYETRSDWIRFKESLSKSGYLQVLLFSEFRRWYQIAINLIYDNIGQFCVAMRSTNGSTQPLETP